MKLLELIDNFINEENGFTHLKIRGGGRNSIKQYTAKAYLLSQKRENADGSHYTKQAWIPKSQASMSHGTLKVPTWLLQKNGMSQMPDIPPDHGMKFYVYTSYKTRDDYKAGKESHSGSGDLVANDDADAIERISAIKKYSRFYRVEIRNDSGKIIGEIKKNEPK